MVLRAIGRSLGSAHEQVEGGDLIGRTDIASQNMMAQEHKLQGLQAARAIAALSVAYFHSYVAVRGAFPESDWLPIPPLARWGFLGVDFFFAISGYVICLVTSRPSFTVGGFVFKRLFRLYPMYWATLIVVVGLIVWGKYAPQTSGHFIYSMTLLPQQGAPAYEVSWTLERELVFYALAALCVPFIGIVGLALVLAGLAFAGWYLGNPWSFHLVSAVQADFLAGVLVYLSRKPIAWLGSAVPLIAGIALLAWTRQHDFLFSVPASMALILAGMVKLELPWGHRPFTWLVKAGDASYSIYLLHYIIFLVASIIGGQWLPFPLPAWSCEIWRFAALIACCLVSYFTWIVIERPMIRLGDRLTRPRCLTEQLA
ncbi:MULTISPECIES: acyltransferase [unclassified Bradyrhizobium]|uniref:acyltransferase family protein n=1 Tax=unclassified Bradyrhizobium TaxID=2631580 RepID=UPI001FFAB599|nr:MULTISPECIES: acyltransferase [unclassified Bradyrhizobium]MCK1332004.1 acyltransferase [Bradyrhizobium sp. CW9]MCK1695135.1 acyltransferase [Bradyrhizobium sp. 144]